MKPDGAKTVYDGDLIDVTLERWGDHEREIVEHPGAVTIVAIDAADNIVLVRQLLEPARTRLLELPAGGLEPGEDPLVAAQRELEEETGLTGGAWERGPAFWTTPGFCRELMHLFFVTGAREGDATPEDDEEIELVRVPVRELAPRLGELEDGKTLVGALLLLRRRAL